MRRNILTSIGIGDNQQKRKEGNKEEQIPPLLISEIINKKKENLQDRRKRYTFIGIRDNQLKKGNKEE